ncbi:TPA: DotH/IcmK family type IV secretion protein [Yersinia enterocolitica]
MKSALFITIIIPILTFSLSVKCFADETFPPATQQAGSVNTAAATPTQAATSAITAQSPAFPTQVTPTQQIYAPESREGVDVGMTNAQQEMQQQLVTIPPSGAFPATTHGQQNVSQGNEQMSMTTTQAAGQIIAPIAPNDVRLLRSLNDEMARATAVIPVSAVPRISSLTADLSPGASIPAVRVAANNPTFIVFEDITGAPWPLAGPPMNPDPANYFISWYPETPTIYVQPKTGYGQGSFGLMLKDLVSPINIILANNEPDNTATSRIYDARISIRIPLRGPLARKNTVYSVEKIALHDEVLQAFLDGVPVQKAKRLKTDNKRVAIWKLGEKIYVRTQLNTKSIFSKTLSSSDGTHVYEMDLTPFVTLTDMSETVSVAVEL